MAVHVRSDGGVLTCWLDNPGSRNALTTEMLSTLIATLEGARIDDAIRGIVIRGANSTFCSGRDLRELDVQDAARPAPEAAIAPVTRLAQAVLGCPVPTVAAIEGKAVGLGVALASWCDIAVAADAARFFVPEARAGVMPTYTAVSLSRTMGRRAALALSLTGHAVSAEQALAFGLVHFVHPSAEFEERVGELLQNLRKGGPQALRGCKSLLERAAGRTFDEAIELAAQASVEAMQSAEAQEGMRAFREKRPPAWYGEGH